jgi:hypothetical protein
MGFLRRDRGNNGPLPSFEEIASSLRADNADLPALLKRLADKLKADLGPQHVKDNRDSSGWEGAKPRDPIKEITVYFGTEATFWLKYNHGVIETTASTPAGVSWGPAGNALPLAEWLVGIHRTALALSQERTEEIVALDEALTYGFSVLEEKPQLDELETVASEQELKEAKGLTQPGRVIDALHDAAGMPLLFSDAADHGVEH